MIAVTIAFVLRLLKKRKPEETISKIVAAWLKGLWDAFWGM